MSVRRASTLIFQKIPKCGVSAVLMPRARRCFSSHSSNRLLLWLNTADENSDSSSSDNNNNTSHTNRHRLLLPRYYRETSLDTSTSSDTDHSVITACTVESIVDAIHFHYQRDTHFVGGMGEGDEGVWFAAAPIGEKDNSNNNHYHYKDVLDYAAIVQESIDVIKQSRHGVPFGIYTSGIVSKENDAVLSQSPEMGVDTIEVSLFAATPDAYRQATGTDNFGQVCGFIVQAAEQDMAVEVSVLRSHASAARDLALSLGARQVHVYDE